MPINVARDEGPGGAGYQIPYNNATSGFFNGTFDFLNIDGVSLSAYDLTLKQLGGDLEISDITNDVTPNGGTVTQGGDSKTVTTSFSSPHNLKKIDIDLGDISGTLNLDFDGTSNPIPSSYFTYTNTSGTFGRLSREARLLFNGGTGTDQINFNGTTNTNINIIDFSNDYDNNNQTFYLDGNDLNTRYGVYTSVEDIQIDLDALEQFRWDGVLELDETINVTNPSAGRILIDSVGNQTVNLNTPSGVETPDDYDNVEFEISGATGNDIINLNTSELLVQQQIDDGLQNTLNSPSTNSYLDIYGDDGDDSININNTALAGEQTSINGLDEDRIYFYNNIDGGEGVDNINFTNSGTIANQEADNGDAYLNFNVRGGNDNDTIDINNTVSKLAEQTLDGAEGSAEGRLYGRFEGDDGDDTINVNNSNVLNLKNLKPSPYDNLKNLKPSPYNNLKNLKPSPYDNLKNLKPSPYDNLKNLKPSPYDNI